jgi:hypothetical protein
MQARKIIGIVFSLIAILFGTIFVLQSDLNLDLKGYFDFSFKTYFSLAYLKQVTPLIVNLTLLYGGILLLVKPSKSNQALALFGFTVLEEVMFHWLGIIPVDFSFYVVAIFLCCALLALWIAV